MWQWIWARYARAARPVAMAAVAPVLPAPSHPRHISGQYASLHAYLENRYADLVVLTFRQIEDLLGFPLPDLASTRSEWWTTTEPGGSERPYSDAWRLAGRTAKPNLLARTVAFERGPSL